MLLSVSMGVNHYVSADDAPTSSVLSVSVCFDEPLLFDVEYEDNVFTQIEMPGCSPFGDVGDPVLPMYPARVLIPYGQEVSDVSVGFNDFKLVDYDLTNRPVVPMQRAMPYSLMDNDFSLEWNTSKYSLDGSISDLVFSVEDIGFCRGFSVLTVYLFPVCYMPRLGLLFYTSKMEISVGLNDESHLDSKINHIFLRLEEDDVGFVQDLVENPEATGSYTEGSFGGDAPFEYSGGLCDPADTYEWVLITNNSLNDTTGCTYNWSDLLIHRESESNLNCIKLTVEDIDACSAYWNDTGTFNDSQAHIREFCKDAYQDWGTQYILLGGDWDGTASHQIVPYRLFTDRDEEDTYDTMACDMYYSHLDGDWYYDAQSIWGGGYNSGANDLYGELYIGRLAVWSADMISNAVYKIINIDTNNSLSQNWRRTCSFWGGDLGWTATSKQYMDEIRLGTNTYRTFTGFEEWNTAHPNITIDTTERLYHADLGATYKTYFTNSIEDDNASIVNHLDHSGSSTPFGLTNWDYKYNNKTFFGYSQGCLGGRFHQTEAGCEQMICEHENRHAYALVLNTGYGYGNMFTTNGASQYIQAYFWDYFFNNQSEDLEAWQLGRAMLYARDKMGAIMNSQSHAWCYAWYSAHLFGDPAQILKLNTTVNSTADVVNPNPSNQSINVDITLSQLSVTITDPDGDTFNWTIETSPNIGSSSGDYATNGSKTCSVSGLTCSNTYYWYVNVTDNGTGNWTNTSYYFTTRDQYTPAAPSGFSAVAGSRFQTDLSWTNDTNASTTRVEWHIESDGSWNVGDHTLLYNDTSESTSHTSLQPSTARYYKAWSWNSTDSLWGGGSTSSATTCSNNKPGYGTPSPANDSTNQDISLIWSIAINDDDGDNFNWSINCSSGHENSDNETSNGTKQLSLSGLSYNTVYTVWVNTTDSYNWTREWYNFTTRDQYTPSQPSSFTATKINRTKINLTWSHGSNSDKVYIRYDTTDYPADRDSGTFLCNATATGADVTGLSLGTTYYFRAWAWNDTDSLWSTSNSDATTSTDSNIFPSTSSPSPGNSSTGQELSLTWSVYISDDDGDNFNWSINCSNGQDCSDNVTSNGTKQMSLSGLSFDTEYLVWVNVTDGYNWTYDFYNFTTRAGNEPELTGNFTANFTSRFEINLTWDKGLKTDYTFVEYKTTSGSWNMGEGAELYNNTGNSTNHTGLNPGSTVYYQVWSYNMTDTKWSTTYGSESNTTMSNNPLGYSSIEPANDSGNQNIILMLWNVTINDDDGDTFNYTIECSNGQNTSDNGTTNGTKQLSISGLNYSTVYTVWVNSTDNYNWTCEWYNFTTMSIPPNGTVVFSSVSPGNGSTGVSISTSSLSIAINDPDGDTFNWTIDTNPDVGNSSANNSNNGSKSCSISGLSYSTTYYWYVNATDLGTGNWTNATYWFTTQSQSGSGSPGGGGTPPAPIVQNVAPTADAGGPYTGVVNTAITFNGSSSSDSDGTIESYSWDFGDDSSGSGETTTHAYSIAGNYTVTLTVEDDDGATDSDTASVKITDGSQDQTDDDSDQNDDENNTVVDDDNDGIPNDVEEDLGTGVNDTSGVENISFVDVIHHLADTDNDGRVDIFYNSTSGKCYNISYVDNDTFLIDEDGDGNWDYSYNLVEQTLSAYDFIVVKENDENDDTNSLLFVGVIVGIIIILVCLLVFMKFFRIRWP